MSEKPVSAEDSHDPELQHDALSKRMDQEDAHSLHVLSTAKVVTTFSAGIAAGLLAIAFQDEGPWVWDAVAAVGLLATFLVTIEIVTAGQPDSPDLVALSDKPVKEIRASRQAATSALRKLADHVHELMVIQLGFALATSAVAVMQVIVAEFS